MKKFLTVVGGLSLGFVVLGVAFVSYTAVQGRRLDALSKAYVEQNVPPIISTWSQDELLKRASPDLMKVIRAQPEQLDQLFKKLSQLGALHSFDQVKGDSNVFYSTGTGKVVTATYVGTGHFQQGEAQISVRLGQAPSGDWQIIYFNVNSPLFLQ